MKAIINIKIKSINGIKAEKFENAENVIKSANKLIGELAKNTKQFLSKSRIDTEINFEVTHG